MTEVWIEEEVEMTDEWIEDTKKLPTNALREIWK